MLLTKCDVCDTPINPHATPHIEIRVETNNMAKTAADVWESGRRVHVCSVCMHKLIGRPRLAHQAAIAMEQKIIKLLVDSAAGTATPPDDQAVDATQAEKNF